MDAADSQSIADWQNLRKRLRIRLCGRLAAKERGIPIYVLSNYKKLFAGQREYTHVWGQKEPMRRNPELEHVFCQKALRRLQYDFPEWARYWQEREWLRRQQM